VVKLGDGADGLPTGSGVAILARNRQGAVRTAGVASLTRRQWGAGSRPGEQNQPTQDLDTPGRSAP
jgi:hypothetical protein